MFEDAHTKFDFFKIYNGYNMLLREIFLRDTKCVEFFF